MLETVGPCSFYFPFIRYLICQEVDMVDDLPYPSTPFGPLV